MRLVKVTALILAGTFAMGSAQAATIVLPKLAADSAVEQVKGSKAGKCGAFMYFDKKGKKCADARLKK